MNVIVPDAHGDWFNQRDDSFSHFMRLDGKKAKEPAIFKNFSLGVATGRDAWCYNFSKNKLSHNIQRLIDNYEKARLKSLESENFVLTRNPTEISWNSNLEQRLKKNAKIKFENSALCKSFYRPFIPSNLYFHVDLVARRYQLASIFPNNSIENLTICSSGVGPKGLCPSGLPTLAAVRLGGWGLRSLRSLRSQPQSQRLGRSGSVKGLSRHILRRCAPCGIPRPLDPASTRNGIRSRAGAEAAALERSGRDRVSTRRSEPLT